MKDYPFNKIVRWLKGAIKSWTIWINSAAGTLIFALPEIERTLPSLTAYIPADYYKWLAISVVASNLLLRAKTNKSLGEK